MVSEWRVRQYFKQQKRLFYRDNGGRPGGEDFNEVWLAVAKKFAIPVHQVKQIVNPRGWFGGWE